MDIVYDYRMLYNALWLNTRANKSYKSRNHYDGKPCCGGGWFVVGTKLDGHLLSNHYKDTPENWNLFNIPDYKNELYEFNPIDTPEEQLKNAIESISKEDPIPFKIKKGKSEISGMSRMPGNIHLLQ